MNIYLTPVLFTIERSRRRFMRDKENVSIISLLYGVFSGYFYSLPIIIFYILLYPSITNIVLFLFLMFILITTYEIGYIFNDNISSRKEGKYAQVVFPLISLMRVFIYSLERIFIVSVSLFLLYYFRIISYTFLFNYVIVLVSLLVLFMFYNLVSVKQRAYVFLLLLRYLKNFVYLVPLLLFDSSMSSFISIVLYSSVLSYFGGLDYTMKKMKCVFIILHSYHMFLYYTIMFLIISVPFVIFGYLRINFIVGISTLLLLFSIISYIGSRVK